jgi:hypothetical protein
MNSVIETKETKETKEKAVSTEKRALPPHLRLDLERQKRNLEIMQLKLDKDIEDLESNSVAE